MKVKIEYTIEISPEQRKALGMHYNAEGPADRELIQLFFREFGTKEAEAVLEHSMRQYYLTLSQKYEAMAKGEAAEESTEEETEDDEQTNKEPGDETEARDERFPW